MADHDHDDTDSSTHHEHGSDTHSLKSLSELEQALPAEPSPQPSDDLPPVPLSPFQFMLAFGSLCVVIFQYSTSVTMVAPSLPYIVMRFQRPDLMGWVGTSYMLTSTALAPVLGKVAGSVGGRAAMITSVALYSAGALISATAPSMEIVIIGRAISGMGGAGMFTIALIIVANIVPFRKRAMYQGYLSALLGVGLVIGPLMGGAFTDWLGWPAIFYWNAVFGAFTLVCLFFVRMDLPRQPDQPTDGVTESTASKIFKRLHDIDWAGLVLLILALVCLLTPLQMGGTASNPWVSPQILVPLLASFVLAAAFVYVEGWVVSPQNAMVPPAVFSTRTVIAAEAMSFCMGASMLCLTYFMPTFWQVVGDRSAMLSGLDTIPILGGMIATSLFSGWVITRYQTYQPFLRFGSPLLMISFVLFAAVIRGPSPPFVAVYFLELAAGVGLGSSYQTRVVTTQAAVPRNLIAAATSLLTMFQGLGGAVAIAIFTTTFNAFLNSNLAATAASLAPNIVVPQSVVTAITASPRSLRITIATAFASSSPEVRETVLNAFLATFVNDFMTTFVVAIPFGTLMFIMGLFINVDLKHRAEQDGSRENPASLDVIRTPPDDLNPIPIENKSDLVSLNSLEKLSVTNNDEDVADHPDTQETVVGNELKGENLVFYSRFR